MFNNNKRDTSSWLRSLYNYTMGVLWIGVGVFVLFHAKFGYDLKLGPALGEIFGVSSILYGLFRVYRGYKIQ